MGVIMLATSASLAEEPTGASLAFTSNDPAVLKALALMDEGKFAQAEHMLQSMNLETPARDETEEIIRRLRIEYSQDADELLAKLQKSIPDVTAADLERWTKAGQAQARVIDGQTKYFNREPANIFRFCDEAKQRRKAAGNEPKEDTHWKLVNHLRDVVQAGEKSSTPEVVPVKHRVTYTLTIPANSKGVKAGSLVRVWLPFPQEYQQQKDVKLISTSPKHLMIAPNGVDGFPVSGGAQRTIFFEQRVADPTKEMKFTEVLEFNSYAYYPKLSAALVQPLPADWNGAYLGERLPHIAFTDDIHAKTREIVGDEPNPLAKVRKIFHWIDENIKYHAQEEYTVVPSFAASCFAKKRGDCGIQTTLFITMCRIAGVPARWQSGWESKPVGWTMHDWSEVYIAPWGWLPCDASYGVQKSDDPRIADFYIGHQDSYRMIVNLDYGRDLYPPKASLRSEPADFQRGEVEVDGRNLYFDEWDYQMTFERDPGPNL
jgi:hypothetical protein